MNSKRIPALIAFAIVIVLLGLWLTGTFDRPKTTRNADGDRVITRADGSTATMGKLRKIKAGDIRIKPVSEAKIAPFRALFPGSQIHACRAIPMINNGIYRLGTDRLVVHDRTAMVVSSAAKGEEDIADEGSVIGRISWGEGACRWTPQKLVTVTGTIEGATAPLWVDGCPLGKPVVSKNDGSFSTRLPSGRRCLARVVNNPDQPLAMGKAVEVDLKKPSPLVLQSQTTPVSEKQVGAAALIYAITREKLRGDAAAEVERLEGMELDTVEAQWLLAQNRDLMTEMADKLAKAANPATAPETVKNVLLRNAN